MNFEPMPYDIYQWQLHMLGYKMSKLGYDIKYIEYILSNIEEIITKDSWYKYLDLHKIFISYDEFWRYYIAYIENKLQQNLKAAMQMKYREDIHIMEFVREQQNVRSLDEAKEIQRNLIRGEREELWGNADIEFTKAQESGNTEAISTASTYRQKLRDAPSSAMISDATTVDQLIPITLDKILES